LKDIEMVKDIKQEIIATEILKGKPDYKAFAVAMQCDDDYAKGNASNYLKAHPEIKAKCIALLEKRADLTRDKALDVISRGLQAKSIGKYGEQQEYVAQLESAKLLLRLYGELGDTQTKSLTLSQHNTYNIVNDIGIDKLRELIAEVKHMNEHSTDIQDGEIV
jgi:hypothetical protein